MIGHMRHGSPPRLLALQSIFSPNRRESLPTPSAGDRISRTEIERDQLLAERARLQEDVRALQERLAAARDEQSRSLRARDQARAELATAQQQLAKRRELAKERVAQVGPLTPPAAPARAAEHAKERVAQADSVPPLLPPARIPERPKERVR